MFAVNKSNIGGGKMEINGKFYTFDNRDCWVSKSLSNKTHWRDILYKYFKTPVAWPSTKHIFKLPVFYQMIKKLEKAGYKVKHEFPGISQGGIKLPLNQNKLPSQPILFFPNISTHYLKHELVTFKFIK